MLPLLRVHDHEIVRPGLLGEQPETKGIGEPAGRMLPCFEHTGIDTAKFRDKGAPGLPFDLRVIVLRVLFHHRRPETAQVSDQRKSHRHGPREHVFALLLVYTQNPASPLHVPPSGWVERK
jgi:hypothetical protein